MFGPNPRRPARASVEHRILMDLFAPEQRSRAFQRCLFRDFVEVSQRFPDGQRAWRAEALQHARAV